MHPQMPHHSLAKPTDSQQRASAISSMGLGPTQPVYQPQPYGAQPYGAQPQAYGAYPYGYPQQPYYAPQPAPPQQPMMPSYGQGQFAQQHPAYGAPQQQQAAYAPQPPPQQQQQQPAYAQPPPPQQPPVYAPAPPVAPVAPTQPISPFTPAPFTPAAAPAAADWGLDGLDFDMAPTPAPAPPAPTPPAVEANDWPAPEGVDPAVWAQLPADMQREVLSQHQHGAAVAPPPSRVQQQASSTGLPRAPVAEDSTHTTIIEVLTRISARTQLTKQWKPSVCVIKNKRELLVFRSRADWQTYRDSGMRRVEGTDFVQALKELQDLLKKHIFFRPGLTCTPIKAKDYKGYGNLHHFTLEESGSVLSKFASTNPNDLFQLRNAITMGVRIGQGLPVGQQDDDALGRYQQ